MSGSEFERENIIGDALSAAAASKPEERPSGEEVFARIQLAPRLPRVSTIPRWRRIPCGVGFIANIKGKKSHQIVSDAISILCNLEQPRRGRRRSARRRRRPASCCRFPHAFFERKAAEIGFSCRSRATMRSARCSFAEGDGMA